MGFIFTVTEGVTSAAAATDGLAAATGALGGVAGAVSAVVPPGLDEISVLNAARLTAHGAQLAAMMELGSVVKEMYGTSVGLSSATYSLADALSAAGIGAIV